MAGARVGRAAFACAAVLATMLIAANSAGATFPGANGPLLISNGPTVATLNPDSGMMRTIIPATSGGAAVTADGRTVYFPQQVLGGINASFFTAGIDGSNPTALPGNGAILPSKIRVTPTGDRILFTGGVATGPNQGGLEGINSIRADGTDVVHLEDDGFRSEPMFDISPDGTRIVYEVAREFRYEGADLDFPDLWTMKIDGTDRRPLVTGKRLSDYLPSWAPDGKRIVFMRSGIRTNGPRPQDDENYYQLRTVKPSGGPSKALSRSSGYPLMSPTYSPDGKQIAVARKGSIYAMPAEGGKLRLLLRESGIDLFPVAWARKPR